LQKATFEERLASMREDKSYGLTVGPHVYMDTYGGAFGSNTSLLRVMVL
jgi:hypothetical protein